MIQQQDGSCAFQCVSLGARQPLPVHWFSDYAFALVRRGILVRQRIDAHGCSTAIDAVGPGGAILMFDSTELAPGGYAAGDALVCVCPKQAGDAAMVGGTSAPAEILRLQAAATDRIERMADARGRPTALGRVSAMLSALADTLAPPRRLTCVPSMLQQRDLAALLTMRHESVCRALGLLERRGLVARSPDGIHIVERTALEAAG